MLCAVSHYPVQFRTVTVSRWLAKLSLPSTLPHSPALSFTVMHSLVQYCTFLHCPALSCIRDVLRNLALSCIVLLCCALSLIILYSFLHSLALSSCTGLTTACKVLHCPAQSRIVLQSLALSCIVLLCCAQSRIVLAVSHCPVFAKHCPALQSTFPMSCAVLHCLALCCTGLLNSFLCR
jgi:hypothetical protein